jgi:hypothetical protein
LERAGKRQATPFARRHWVEHPKRPGRKAGKGKFARRELPQVHQIQETKVAKLHGCPECGGKLRDIHKHEQYVITPYFSINFSLFRKRAKPPMLIIPRMIVIPIVTTCVIDDSFHSLINYLNIQRFQTLFHIHIHSNLVTMIHSTPVFFRQGCMNSAVVQ